MAPKLTDHEQEQLRQLLELESNPESNGEEAERRRQRVPRFDGTINLGHVLSIVAMIGGLATMWVNTKVTSQDHESRIRALEEVSKEFKNTIGKMAETEAQAMRNQDRIAIALEYLTKQPKSPQ